MLCLLKCYSKATCSEAYRVTQSTKHNIFKFVNSFCSHWNDHNLEIFNECCSGVYVGVDVVTCAQQRHVMAQDFCTLCGATADTRSRHQAVYFGEGEFDPGALAVATSWTRRSNQGGELL